MRLYRLTSRFGRKKRRLYPWFDPVPAGFPKSYDGWNWDPALGDWVSAPIEPVTVVVDVPRYPKPTEPPVEAKPSEAQGWRWDVGAHFWESVPLTRAEGAAGLKPWAQPTYIPAAAGPTEVEGWAWFEQQQEWVATIVMGQSIRFTPPQSLPPGVDLASVFPADPYFLLAFETAQKLVETGRWDILQQGDAFFKLVYEVHRLAPDAKYPVHIAEGMFEARYIMHAKRVWLASEEAWRMRINALDTAKFEGAAVGVGAAILFLVTALTGFLIGTIMERLTFPEDPAEVFIVPRNNYLVGPDDWRYSKHIGSSRKGTQYYSACEGIGTEYVRFKRGLRKGYTDVIDFPGGFVETGYQFPYWVKYTWSYWEMEYVGMLFSVGAEIYALKEADQDVGVRYMIGFILPAEEWCSDFHYYL